MAGEDKYQTMAVTPEGSIIRFADKKMKPETDPDWEAKRQRLQDDA